MCVILFADFPTSYYITLKFDEVQRQVWELLKSDDTTSNKYQTNLVSTIIGILLPHFKNQ